jgi:hypothetical protein
MWQSRTSLHSHLLMEVVRYMMRVLLRLMQKLTGRGFDIALTCCAYTTASPVTPRVMPRYVSSDFPRQKHQLALLIDMSA